jgi:hypothetical protein
MTTIDSNIPLLGNDENVSSNMPSTPEKITPAAIEALSSPARNTTPIKARKRQNLGSPSSRTFQRVCVIPPTPMKPTAFKKPKFDNPALTAKSFGTELPIVESNFIETLQEMTGLPLNGRMYELPSGELIAAVQQPLEEKPTCGPGCVLMIALQNMEKLNNDLFWSWYGSTRLANATSLLNGFKALAIPAKICRLTRSELDSSVEHKVVDSAGAIAHLKETIQMTNQPVIVAITHPVLMGHWIIIDGFDNVCAFIRDPYTGKAFALPEATLSKWLLEKESIQDMVYFSPSSQG